MKIISVRDHQRQPASGDGLQADLQRPGDALAEGQKRLRAALRRHAGFDHQTALRNQKMGRYRFEMRVRARAMWPKALRVKTCVRMICDCDPSHAR
ncbi:hypothetical protein [Aestuariivita sp.]|uniref:hypothetical protein n=1 Tax=Aestuariivita sp. TaxID=1872407 RepID=UPI003BAE8A2D